MAHTASTFNKSVSLLAAGAYFCLCGASAIFWPSLWYLAAGITEPNSNLALAIVGVMMLGLGLGAFLAKTLIEEQLILKLYILANLGDALIVAYYTSYGDLPSR